MTITLLQRLLVGGYEDLKRRLARRLGSEEFAAETLNETYLQLGSATREELPRSPTSYLIRAALNVAAASRRRVRHVGGLDAQALDVADAAPDPGQRLEGRLAMDALAEAMAELPPRQRQILMEARLGGLKHAEIAARLGISRRTVLKDLDRALGHLSRRLREGDEEDPVHTLASKIDLEEEG